MMISTGLMTKYASKAKVEEELKVRAESRGLKIVKATIEVSIVGDSKVATCEATKKGD